MHLMSIDPGSANIGIAIFDNEKLLYCTRLNYVSNQEKFNEKINDILNRVYLELLRLAYYYEVDHVCWEVVPAIGGFSNHDKVVAVSAIPKTLAFQLELPFQGIAAITAKKVMTGNHKATKIMMRDKVYELYPNFKQDFPAVKYNHWDTFDAVMIGRSCLMKKNWTTPKSSNLTGRSW